MNVAEWDSGPLADWQYKQLPNLVTPFDGVCINPNSMDLRLGNEIRRSHPIWRELTPSVTKHLWSLGLLENIPKWGEVETFDKCLLMPGEFVLCHSLEFINIPDDMLAILMSKSSTGRIGIEHLHAGLGDAGWNGEWTWELHNVAPWPNELIAGKRIMQMILVKLSATVETSYKTTGRYNGQMGPTESKGI